MNHADEARAALKAAQDTPAEEVITDPWLLEAQAHALLEIADQMRISNLLKWAELNNYPSPLLNEITSALGIGDPQ